MPEYQSVLRASKGKDGGATAELVVNAPDGPIRFSAIVAPKTAESIRQAIFSWVHAGQPDQAKKVAKAAVMGADPDALAEPSYKDNGPVDTANLAQPDFRKRRHHHGGGKKGGLVAFKPDPDDVTPPTTFDATSTGLFVGLADDAVMGVALRILRDRTPAKFQKALASAAMNAANARKRHPRQTTSGDTFKFYEDEELANPMDQLSQWVPPPLGVPKSFEEAAVISGEHEEAVAISGYGADLVSRQRVHALGRRAQMAGEDVNDVKLAKYALIDMWNKKQPGKLQAVKYSGPTPEGKYAFQTKSKDGKEDTFNVSKSDAGYAIFKQNASAVQGDSTPIMPSTVDVKDAKNVLVTWYASKKPGTLQAVSYQGVSPVSNKLKFLAKTADGLQGYEMERSDIGWRATAMSGDEVGLFGFIKKAASAVSSAAKGVAKGAYKYGKKGIVKAEKGVEAAGKAISKVALMAALGPLIIPMRKYLSSHGIGPLATRRANFLAFQASGGKVRKATPDQVKAQVPWAKAHFSSKIPSFLRSIVSGDCPDHVIIRRSTVVGGSYGRFDLLAPGDNLHAKPFVGGVGVVVPTRHGRKRRKYMKVAAFTLPIRRTGVVGDDGSAPAQAAPSAPPPSLGSIISAPFHWLGNVIGTILGSPSTQQQAPAQLPASPDDASLADQSAAMDAGATPDDGSMSPDGSDGSMAPDDGSSYDDTSASPDDGMSGTFVGRHKHGAGKGKGPHTGQGGQLFKKLGDAITAAGIPLTAGAVWDRPTTSKVAGIARQSLGKKKIGHLLRAFVKKNQIKITLPNGAVMGDIYGAPPAAPPPAYPQYAPPAAPPAAPPPPGSAWRGVPTGPKGASRRRHHRYGRQGGAVTTGLRRAGTAAGTTTATGPVMTTVMTALTSASININQGTIWTQDIYNSAISAAVSALTTNKASLPAKAQAKDPNSLGRALVKGIVRRRAIKVQGKNGQFYTITAANGKWVLDTTSTPPDFTSKLNLVRNTFVAERDRQHNLIVSQNRDDSNFNQSIGLAKSSLQTAGLPIDQIRLSPQGTLLAGTFIGAFDTAKWETDNFIETGNIKPSDEESEKAMFNDGMWIDKDVIEKKEVAELDDQIEDDSDEYGTSEHALWMRPALVGTFIGRSNIGDTDPATGLDKLWWQPLQYFQDSSQKVYNAAALATTAATAAAAPSGGGGGGGPSGGGGGGGDDGGGGGDAAPDDGGGDDGGAAPDDGGGGGGGEMDPADYERAQEAEG